MKTIRTRAPLAQNIDDVCEHLSGLRRYYFDVVSATEDEVTVTLKKRKPDRPAGFRSRRLRG